MQRRFARFAALIAATATVLATAGLVEAAQKKTPPSEQQVIFSPLLSHEGCTVDSPCMYIGSVVNTSFQKPVTARIEFCDEFGACVQGDPTCYLVTLQPQEACRAFLLGVVFPNVYYVRIRLAAPQAGPGSIDVRGALQLNTPVGLLAVEAH